MKKRRIALYEEDNEAHKIFIIYHQGAWRIAYFEDDRALMEEVLEEPVMQETIEKLLGDLEPRRNEDGNADCGKRRATLSPFIRRNANESPEGDTTMACDGNEECEIPSR